MIDARETAPGAATGDMYLDADGKPVEDLSRDGPLAAGIPGIPAALDHITKSFGVRSIEENLAPAIRAAREGFPVNEKLAGRITASAHRFSPAAKAVFLPGGMLPSVGDRLKQEDLAQTLEQIARKGREGFYEGPLAKKLQQGAYRDGGIWSLEDLADYRIKEREPTRFSIAATRSPPPHCRRPAASRCEPDDASAPMPETCTRLAAPATRAASATWRAPSTCTEAKVRPPAST